jgi:hypothetical protein
MTSVPPPGRETDDHVGRLLDRLRECARDEARAGRQQPRGRGGEQVTTRQHGGFSSLQRPVARTYVPRPLQSSAGIIFGILIRHSLAGSMVRSRSADADNSASAAWRAFAVNRPIRPEIASAPRNSPARSKTGTATAATWGSRSPSDM